MLSNTFNGFYLCIILHAFITFPSHVMFESCFNSGFPMSHSSPVYAYISRWLKTIQTFPTYFRWLLRQWCFKYSLSKNTISYHKCIGILLCVISCCYLSKCSSTFHLKGFSLMCVRMWYFRFQLSENNFPQTSHLNGFSPVCVNVWCFRLPLLENALPQVSHLKGFSPVWIRTWLFRFPLLENAFPQISHTEGLSPVCVRRWCFMPPLSRNTLPHMSHLNDFTPLWIRTWRFRLQL